MPLNETTRTIEELIRKSDNETILFVGIGNVLRKDDGVGVYISRKIRETKNISALTVEVSIENYIGKINSLHPGILVLIDCMDLNQPPGSYAITEIDKIADHTFNTHNISLNRLSEFFPMAVRVLGIQPQYIDFGESLSFPVKEAADRIICYINRESLNKSF
jgi:hydrogenase 3 maturation protease